MGVSGLFHNFQREIISRPQRIKKTLSPNLITKLSNQRKRKKRTTRQSKDGIDREDVHHALTVEEVGRICGQNTEDDVFV